MPRIFPILPAALAAVLALTAPAPAAPAGDEAGAPSPELLEKPYLFEVVRHLYRWYLDEVDLERAVTAGEMSFLVRGLEPSLDPDDRSRLGLIVLPALGITVKVKQADYTIEELGITVSNDTFKIINVARIPASPGAAEGAVEVRSGFDEMKEYLFATRNRLEFPSEDLTMRLRLAVRAALRRSPRDAGIAPPTEPQAVHVSSLSPVANELWVFWENGRRLFRFASDIDLRNPAVWAHEDLMVDVYDIDEQVVVSLDEVAGSNAYLTRDQVGRALFNCIVLGKRIVLDPAEIKVEE